MNALTHVDGNELLEAARALVLPVEANPEQGLIILYAAAMLVASLSVDAGDPAADIEEMVNEIRENAIEFVQICKEPRFDA